MLTTSELKSELAQFIGTEQYHYSPFFAWLTYTDGVKHFLEKGGTHGSYWFMDWCGNYLKGLRKQHAFMTIDLIANDDSEFKIRVTDGNDHDLMIKTGSYTDLQHGTWKFFMQNGVLMLPSEY